MTNYLKLWVLGGLLSFSLIMAKQLLLFGVHPLYLAVLQTIGSIFLLAHFGIHGLINSLQRKFSFYLWASLLGFTIPQLVALYAVEHVGASVVALFYVFPLFMTFFLSLFVYNIRPQMQALFFMLTAFLGSILFLYKPDVVDRSHEQGHWLLILCLAPLALSFANVYRSQRWPDGVPVYHVALLTNIFSFASYALLVMLQKPALPDINPEDYAMFLTLASFMLVAAISQYLLFSLQKTATPSFIGQIGSIKAVCGGGLGYIFFQESYPFTTLFGSLLILLGVTGFSRQALIKSA